MFGPHLIADFYQCSKERLSDLAGLTKLLDELPSELGMTKVMPPYVFEYHGKVKEDWGLTGIVIIAESHISMHTFPDKGFSALDVFSCKAFNAELSLNRILGYFQAKRYDSTHLDRGREFPRSPSRIANILQFERKNIKRP